MSFAVASRNLRDALVASVARLSASARQQVALISHDARSFLRLLARTFSGLPADVIAASVAINLLGLALPLAILQVYDRIVPHGATATLTLLMTGIACALVLEAILRITRSYVIAWSAMKLAWKTNVDAARRVVTAPAELVDAQPAARWIQRLQAVATVSEFNISSAPLVLIDLVFVVMFLPLLVACSRWIAGIPLAIFFLFGIAAVNLVVLRSIWRTFLRVRAGEPYVDEDFDLLLGNRGFLARLFRPMFRMITRSWHMYPLGVLFGLGFDTATEIGVLGISAAEASKGLPFLSILIFPALFAAGMSLIDTTDNILMLGAYGWAFVKPIRKLYYNMTITSVSVVVALAVGGIEALGLLAGKFHLKGGFWDAVTRLNEHFGTLGYFIVGLFVFSWVASVAFYKWRRFDELELGT